ncbi:MAG TPA: hypothetical protein VND20_02700 [Candidatus Binataceae bacterium]|nr:hypothetical protein [Candidatus Binataceae bacterium]
MPALREGDRVLIIDRKLFKDDNTRFFVGVIEEYDEVAVRVRGYPFHLSPYEVSGSERHGDERSRVISMSAGDLIYLLPANVEPVKIQLRRSPKSLMLTDGESLSLDLSEWLMRV